MRKSDKMKNFKQANLIAEQLYLKNKGIVNESSRYDNKFTDFNEWIDVCTKDINQNSYYSSGKVDLIKDTVDDNGRSYRDLYGEMSWDELMNEIKAMYQQTGNVYPIFEKYGWVYNSDLGYSVIGGSSNSKNNRNLGCYKNGDLKLCWSSFEAIGEWDNDKKEGVGPMTQGDAEKLSNAIYPTGSRKD